MRWSDTQGDGSRPSMVALVGCGAEAARGVLEQLHGDGRAASASIANDNAPGQAVLSGSEADVEAAAEAVRDAGHRFRAVSLDVSAAFHSPRMQLAARALRLALTPRPGVRGSLGPAPPTDRRAEGATPQQLGRQTRREPGRAAEEEGEADDGAAAEREAREQEAADGQSHDDDGASSEDSSDAEDDDEHAELTAVAALRSDALCRRMLEAPTALSGAGCPVITNASAAPVRAAAALATDLVRQTVRTVRWREGLQAAAAVGPGALWLELGPGNTLSALAKRNKVGPALPAGDGGAMREALRLAGAL